jgi:hypothetical protein
MTGAVAPPLANNLIRGILLNVGNGEAVSPPVDSLQD